MKTLCLLVGLCDLLVATLPPHNQFDILCVGVGVAFIVFAVYSND